MVPEYYILAHDTQFFDICYLLSVQNRKPMQMQKHKNKFLIFQPIWSSTPKATIGKEVEAHDHYVCHMILSCVSCVRV